MEISNRIRGFQASPIRRLSPYARAAKARGIKFTFGTNNVDADFGRLEYALQAVKECGLTKEDMWFPPMSIRKDRETVDYNHFSNK